MVELTRRNVPTPGHALRTHALALLIASSLALTATNAAAKQVRVSHIWNLAAPPEAVLDTVLAFESTCRRGCAHYVPHLVKTVVLSYQRHPDDFYVWMSVEDIQNAEWFSHVTVRRFDKHVRVVIQMVDPTLATTLQKSTGQAEDPAFDECTTVYDVYALDVPGGGPRSRTAFTSVISLSGFAAFFGSGIARGRLEEAAEAVRRDLASLKAVQP
jgi:hypothetical protein